MKPITYLVIFLLGAILNSCSDAEIVAGTFHGKLYASDTVNADVQVTQVNDGIIRLDVTSPMLNGGYVEYAQLRKNAENAFGLEWTSATSGSPELGGYYYDGYLVFDSWTNQYKFSGGKE
jgi:hypothetical protein